MRTFIVYINPKEKIEIHAERLLPVGDLITLRKGDDCVAAFHSKSVFLVVQSDSIYAADVGKLEGN